MDLFKRSEETNRIVGFLRMLDKGAEITYREISEHVGAPLSSRTAKLIYARVILQRDHNAVWICVRPNVGLRRLNDVEIADRLRPWWLKRARNGLRRAGDEVEVVDTSALNLDQMARFGVDCVQRELAFNSLSIATRNRMEKVARGTSNDLPSFNILEWAISFSPPKRKAAE
jgi:alkylated DNA nucleotide flippase Atl1